MAINVRAVVILLTASVALLMLYADRGARTLTAIAKSAMRDPCVMGTDPHVRRSASYSENGQSFRSKLCSRTSATWENREGQLTLNSVQAIEPVSWLPDDLNIYAPAGSLLKHAGKPDKIDKGGRADFYYYQLTSRTTVVFQVPAERNVIGSVLVEYR
jgi:hypothetical protein